LNLLKTQIMEHRAQIKELSEEIQEIKSLLPLA